MSHPLTGIYLMGTEEINANCVTSSFVFTFFANFQFVSIQLYQFQTFLNDASLPLSRHPLYLIVPTAFTVTNEISYLYHSWYQVRIYGTGVGSLVFVLHDMLYADSCSFGCTVCAYFVYGGRSVIYCDVTSQITSPFNSSRIPSLLHKRLSRGAARMRQTDVERDAPDEAPGEV